MGGNADDFAAANTTYTYYDAWLDRHEFMPFWQEFGECPFIYCRLEDFMQQANKLISDMPGVFSKREIMERLIKREADERKAALIRLEKEVAQLQKLEQLLENNTELYN